MLRDVTEALLRGEDLGFEQANLAVNSILEGECSEAAIAGFLTALAAKGEKAPEVAGMASGLCSHAVGVKPASDNLVDIVGTGGDGRSTFNISTTSAIVAAGAGVKVAKHGNRAITSKCGSADVLAELGVKIDAAPEVIAQCIDEAGIGFMFAPCHHPTMKYVQPIRKALGYRTVFNVLGPLANPARVGLQVVGVASVYLLEVMAEALNLLGVSRAMVVHGDGMDEFTTSGPTDIVELRDGKLIKSTINYADFGFVKSGVDDLAGGTLAENAAMTRDIISGKIVGPRKDVVLMTAAAAILIAGLADDFAGGIEAAGESISSGGAVAALEKMIEISNS